MYNPFSLTNKTVLVTGASSGIGRAVAIECSKMGANVAITGRHQARLNETFNLLEGKYNLQYVVNLEDDAEMDVLLKSLPNLDGIVHCAGITAHKPYRFLKKNDFNEMFNINFFASSQITIGLLNLKKINKEASIVFITSIMGIFFSYYGGALYSSTKGAINGLIKGVAIDLAPKKIRVNGVMPAMINTEILDKINLSSEQINNDIKRYPLNRYGKPEEVAYAAIYLLSDAAKWITGSNILLDGGRTISY